MYHTAALTLTYIYIHFVSYIASYTVSPKREKVAGNLHVVTTDPSHNRIRVAHKKLDRTYQYDNIFGPFASQEEVFTKTVEPIVREMLQVRLSAWSLHRIAWARRFDCVIVGGGDSVRHESSTTLCIVAFRHAVESLPFTSTAIVKDGTKAPFAFTN